jgi:hypothetical protein
LGGTWRGGGRMAWFKSPYDYQIATKTYWRIWTSFYYNHNWFVHTFVSEPNTITRNQPILFNLCPPLRLKGTEKASSLGHHDINGSCHSFLLGTVIWQRSSVDPQIIKRVPPIFVSSGVGLSGSVRSQNLGSMVEARLRTILNKQGMIHDYLLRILQFVSRFHIYFTSLSTKKKKKKNSYISWIDEKF